MRLQKPNRLFKVAAIFLFAMMFLSWSRAGVSSQSQALDGPQSPGQPQDRQGRLDVLGYQSTLQEKLGRDDGVSFIIHFGGDTHGNLDVCG